MASTGNSVFILQMTIRGPTMTNAIRAKIKAVNAAAPTLYFIMDLLQSLQFSQFPLDGLVLAFSPHGRALLVDPPHMLFAV